MVTTMYKKDSRNIYYIPADIVLKDKEYLAFDQGKVTCCCNVVGYNFEAVSGDPVLILEWVLYSPHGFNFSTIHEIDDELFELLESVRAITRFDGRVDLKVFYNYEFDVCFVEDEGEYRVCKITPQDDSYAFNIKAFYEPAVIISDLTNRAFQSMVQPRRDECVQLEFEIAGKELSYYTSEITDKFLEGEVLHYDVNTDMYKLSVNVATVEKCESDFLYIIWRGRENNYRTRLKNTYCLFCFLLAINVIKSDESSNVIQPNLFCTRFEIVFKKIGAVFQYIDLRANSERTEEYWEYLMDQATTETE